MKQKINPEVKINQIWNKTMNGSSNKATNKHCNEQALN